MQIKEKWVPVRSNPLFPSFPTLLSPAKAKFGLTAHTKPGPTASSPLCLPGGQPALGPGRAGPASRAHSQGRGEGPPLAAWVVGAQIPARRYSARALTVRGREAIPTPPPPTKRPLLFYFSFPFSCIELKQLLIFLMDFFFSSFKMKG